MAAPVQTREPVQFVGGDSVAWQRTLSSYPPSDGWTLRYRLLGPLVDVTISDAGASGTFSLAFAPADTDQVLLDTDCRLVGWVTLVGGESHSVYDGPVRVLSNVRFATTATDVQTHVERCIASLEARIEARITADVSRYGREGAFVDKIEIAELRRILGGYRKQLWQMQNPGQISPMNVMRFAQAGRSNPAERLAYPGHDV